MKKRTIFNLIFCFLAIAFISMPALSHAAWLINIQPPDVVSGSQLTNFEKAVPYLFSLMIEVAGLIFIVLLLLGGIMYMTSQGNEEGASKAKKWILDAVIGLVIVALSWAAGTWIENSLLNTGQTNTGTGTGPVNSGSQSNPNQISTGNIIGTTVDKTGATVPYVDVIATTSGKDFTMTSDSLGHYQISNAPFGTYTIRFSKSGYDFSAITYTLQANSSSVPNNSTSPTVNTDLEPESF